MSEENDTPESLKNNVRDHIAVVSKAVLGAVPFGGSVLAELAGAVIPNQRIDRLAKFSIELEKRLDNLEEGVAKSKWQDDEFLELAEETIRQAARSTSDKRREQLAKFLAESMTDDQVSSEDRRHLLRMFGELSDVEVIWLMSFSARYLPDEKSDEFFDRHEHILMPARNYSDAPQEEHDKAVLQESYKIHLMQLGLLTKSLRLDKNKQPELELNRKSFKGDYAISPLGRMLLEVIDVYAEEDEWGA